MIDDVVFHQEHAHASNLIPGAGVDRIELSRAASHATALLGAESTRHDGEHRRGAGRLDEQQAEPEGAQAGVCWLGVGVRSHHHHAVGCNADRAARQGEQIACAGTVQAPTEEDQVD